MYDRSFKPYLYLIQNYSIGETSITNCVCKTPPIYTIYYFDLFFHAISYDPIRVGARLVLLIYLCFPAHYGFTRYMDFFADEYHTLYIFFPL